MATTAGTSILSPLTGSLAELASVGTEPSLTGLPATNGVTVPGQPQQQQQPDPLAQMAQPFAGMGPLLEEPDDAKVFRAVHDLVLRQERLARNRYAQDLHYTRIRRGIPFSRLEKVQDQDVWRAVLPPGSSRLTAAAVPNKADDLCNKIVETLLVDLPKPQPKASNDNETADRAAEIAEQFLLQDGMESGTNDPTLFWNALDASMTRASGFLYARVDRYYGGWQPKRILAHPLAADPSRPTVGPDGNPTTDLILRYVTPQNQFTEDPSQADRVWLPGICAKSLGREHIRTIPETADVWDATALVVLDYCTLAEAKLRWQAVAEMQPSQLVALLDWVPPRPRVLLPAALRSRWRAEVGGGNENDPTGQANLDQRIMFFYTYYITDSPDYPEGACIDVTGANGGYVLEKGLWSAEVPHPQGGSQVKCLDLPLTQFRPVADPDDRDPTGRPIIERFAGANEARATLWTAYLEQIDKILHPNLFLPFSGPEGWQLRVRNDDPIVLQNGTADKPFYETPPPLPGDFQGILGAIDTQMESVASQNKPLQGADNQQEVSGVARQIAVQQGLMSMSRLQQATMIAIQRWWRIKLQLAQAFYQVPQQIQYVGEDGAYKQEWWTGADFIGVEDVAIQPGTGTMMPPQTKQQYIQVMQQMGGLQPDEAASLMRDALSDAGFAVANISEQRIERQVSAWLKGPPQNWVQQYQAYQQEQAQIQQHMQPVIQQWQQAAQQAQASGQPVPPQPQAPAPQTPAPWTPFAPSPVDDEMTIAQVRHLRLRKLLESARFASYPPEWQQIASAEYSRMRQAATPPPPAPALPKGVSVQMKGDASSVGAEEQAALKGFAQQAPQRPQQPQPAQAA